MVTDFIFDGQALSDWGYMLCSFDAINLEKATVSDITFDTIKSALSDVSKKVSASYNDNLNTTIQICKNMCDNSIDEYLTKEDISEMTKWLCRKDYKFLQFLNDKDDDEIFYEVQNKVNKVMLGDNCIGLEIIITSNRPYAVTNEFFRKIEFQANKTKNIIAYSDDEGYVYPDVIITLKEDGDLKINNAFEDRNTVIKNCVTGEVITFNAEVLQISSNKEHDFASDFNYNFLRLCNTFKENINKITSNLACTMEIRYRGIRKVGM